MDVYERHQRIWRVLHGPVSRWICRKFNMTHEDLKIDGPVLLIPNHVNAWDPLLVAMSLKDKQVYYVASEHLFRLGLVSRLLNWLVAPIPRRKASSGTDTVKACLRHLRAGHSICLFAEGEQCWDGRNNPVFTATGKLAKSSGATLVTYRLEGAYLSKPRWAKSVRRGRVHGHPVNIYPPEQLKAMSPAEINAAIERDCFEDAWQRQREWRQLYRGKKLAEGLERAMYLCPRCRRIGTLKTENDRIFCDCGLSLRYEETGFFSPAEPFETLADWEDWQKQALHGRSFEKTGEALFSDPEVLLTEIKSDHGEKELGRGMLTLYEDRLCCAGREFPLAEIRDMAPVQTYLLLLSVGEQYYQIRSDEGANLRKYLETWSEHS
jgi:1-acyl-sn-glycerol-3-phosphate acyltransferase